MAEIGIKLADGSFFPILGDDAPSRKRLVLTTAREHQNNVQIDLLRRHGEEVGHVGTLLLEDLGDDDTDGAEIVMVVGCDGSGTVDARISTPDDSQYQSLSISLDDVALGEAYDLPDIDSGIDGVEDLGDLDLPDFDLDSDTIDADGFEDSVNASYDSEVTVGAYDDDTSDFGDTEEEELPPRSFSGIALIAILLIALSLVALATFGIFSLLETEVLPELRSFAPLSAVAWPRRRRKR